MKWNCWILGSGERAMLIRLVRTLLINVYTLIVFSSVQLYVPRHPFENEESVKWNLTARYLSMSHTRVRKIKQSRSENPGQYAPGRTDYYYETAAEAVQAVIETFNYGLLKGYFADVVKLENREAMRTRLMDSPERVFRQRRAEIVRDWQESLYFQEVLQYHGSEIYAELINRMTVNALIEKSTAWG